MATTGARSPAGGAPARHVRGGLSRRELSRAGIWAVLLVGSVVMLAPLIWMVSSSFKVEQRVFMFPPQLIPNPFHPQNYVEALTYKPFPIYLRNTVFLVLMNELAIILAASFCAYGFARLKARGKEIIFYMVLGTMMIPLWVTIIPQYVLFSWLHWTNSYLPLMVPPWFGWPFFIFLLRQFFMSIPRDLDDSARIDGASTWGILWHIILPLSKPALVTVTVFAFIGNWNNFIGPLIYIRDTDKYTLAIGLQRFQGIYGVVQYHYMMAVATLIVLPIVIVFFLAQNLFVKGIVMTGIKG